MELSVINTLLAQGEIEKPGLFPHLARLKESLFVFNIDFGLSTLPIEPGLLLIRGARQYGKSTWLESSLKKTIEEFGAGSAYYLNGDNIASYDDLEIALDEVISGFAKDAHVRRVFIDEITSIPNWERALKRMADAGKLEKILVITTGSTMTDLRRGTERLPGRKGKLARTTYLFTPISYREFYRVCGKVLAEKALIAYLLSGGSPIAAAELASYGMIPEYVVELVRDWIEGEIAISGRNRQALFNVMSVLFRLGGSAVGQAKLAREAGLTNNTVAAGYIEVLSDLGCIIPCFPWDPQRNILILRKPCKYHFTNLLVALSYHSANIRSPEDFMMLPKQVQGIWYEWLIAQELQRRAAINGNKILTPLAFWQNKEHEIDFVDIPDKFYEVKRGKSTAINYTWFNKVFPHERLTVINQNSFETDWVKGQSFESFLLEE